MRILPASVLICIVLFLQALSIRAEEVDGIRYNFVRKDDQYEFEGRFSIGCTADYVTRVIYDPEHLSKFVKGAEVILIEQGNNWQEVRFTYRRFLLENSSVYRRMLDPGGHKVTFSLISSTQQGLFVPHILSSSGFYEVKTEERGSSVFYFQEATLSSGLFKGLYLNADRTEAVQFLKDLRDYVRKLCP
jgi:hypothetical protein